MELNGDWNFMCKAINKHCNGHPVIVDIYSINHDTILYTQNDTRVELGNNGYYLHNVYSGHVCGNADNIKFHKKLKIHGCDTHGCYVNCNGIRCYMNGLITPQQKYEITGIKEYYPNAKGDK